MSAIWPYLAGIVPTILVATMFYFLIKSMIEGDRRERLAQSRFDAEEDRERHRTADTQPSDSVVEREISGPGATTEPGSTTQPGTSGSSAPDS